MSQELCKIEKKGEKPLLIHPSTLKAHRRQGWEIAQDPPGDDTLAQDPPGDDTLAQDPPGDDTLAQDPPGEKKKKKSAKK